MAKLKPGESKMIEGLFPGKGLDVSCELGRQPPLTAPESVNVRTFEPRTNRARGGSRPGQVRFNPDRLNGIADLQHLCTLVTTDPVNLAAGVTPPLDFEGFMLDPSSGVRVPSGRVIPIGGSGVSQNRNVSNANSQDESVSNLIPGEVKTVGASYVVDIVPIGSRTVSNAGQVALVEGQPVIVVKLGSSYYMQGGA